MQFDPVAATQAYIDTLSAQELALSRAYTTGNHWLIVGGLVVSAIITALIVKSGVLSAVFRRLENRSWAWRVIVIAAVFLLIDSTLLLGWDLYADWWRETQYGRTSQPLSDFLAQNVISILLVAVLGSLFTLGVYALIKRFGRLWWAWSAALVAGAGAFFLLLSPVVLEPLFNEYEPIPEGEVRDAVLALAADAGVPEDRVFMFDGSRQSNNFTANVSGVGSSARIAISDVAMGSASLDEVIAVTGHEIGHYILNHVWRNVGLITILAVLVFYLTDRTYPWFARRFGAAEDISDPRGLPVFLFVVGLFLTLTQPIANTVTRIVEREADVYSLESVGLPDALASALIKTAEYRYPLAGPMEEAIFYTHPTVETRVRMAMEWKAANPDRDRGTQR